VRKGVGITGWLQKQWFYLGMAGVLILGYVWVRSGLWLGERSGLLVVALMFVMGLGLSPKGILAQLRKVRALGLFLLASYLLAPLVAWAAAWVFFRGRQDLFTGLIIVGATATTLSSSIVWTRLAGGNGALALVMSITGNSLQFLVTPTWLGLMLGASVKFNVTNMMEKLLLVVLVPVLASQVVVVLSRERVLQWRPLTNVVARLLVLAVIWVAVSKAASDLLTTDALYSSLAVIAVHLVLLAVGWWVLGRLLAEHGDRIALLFCGGQKTLPSSTMIATTYFAHLSAAVLPVLLYHFWQLILDSLLLDRLNQHESIPGETEELVSADG